jgi:hypothetical protein
MSFTKEESDQTGKNGTGSGQKEKGHDIDDDIGISPFFLIAKGILMSRLTGGFGSSGTSEVCMNEEDTKKENALISSRFAEMLSICLEHGSAERPTLMIPPNRVGRFQGGGFVTTRA